MCPKCKSRERVVDSVETVIGCGIVGYNANRDTVLIYPDLVPLGGADFEEVTYETFFCSDCGYEIGRYG